jgi:plasmid maintenance system antidote protein VapI
MSDQQLITALRAKLGRLRRGDGGTASQARVAQQLGIDQRRISEVLLGQRELDEATRAKAERLASKVGAVR